MGASGIIGIIGILFLVAAIGFLLIYHDVLLFGSFIAIFLILLTGAYFASVLKKGNAEEARVKARQGKATRAKPT
jgi:multisubunit Na+/H+ antiporter MnhG subunit